MTDATLAPGLTIGGQRLIRGDDRARHEITASLRAHEELIFQFTSAWYQSPYTFQNTRVLGYPACKIPLDLWIIHDLFCQYRFETVIELGTAGGGTTLWYAILMDLLGLDGRVISIDINLPEDGKLRPVHPRIEYRHGSSVDRDLAASVSVTGPVLLNLDSDHHAPHVLKELELWAPRVPIGSWLIVEDTNGAPVEHDAAGHQVQVEGPLAAVMEYLQRHPGEWIREVSCERYWLTMNPHGWLQRERECVHA